MMNLRRQKMDAPLVISKGRSIGTVVTLASVSLASVAISFRSILEMTLDLLRPDPEAGAPAFCAKKISSVSRILPGRS